jgi:hypothetical protein
MAIFKYNTKAECSLRRAMPHATDYGLTALKNDKKTEKDCKSYINSVGYILRKMTKNYYKRKASPYDLIRNTNKIQKQCTIKDQ